MSIMYIYICIYTYMYMCIYVYMLFVYIYTHWSLCWGFYIYIYGNPLTSVGGAAEELQTQQAKQHRTCVGGKAEC